MENISTGDGNKETLNGGGDAVQHQVERVPLGESKEGAIFNKPGSQGGLQKGDGHFLQEEEESSGGDAGAFGAAHELEAVKTSESEGQPDERLLTEGASQHTALAEEREAIDTNQVSGSQNKDSHLQAASSGTCSLARQTLCQRGKGLVSSRTRSCAGDRILSRPIRSPLFFHVINNDPNFSRHASRVQANNSRDRDGSSHFVRQAVSMAGVSSSELDTLIEETAASLGYQSLNKGSGEPD